jgi:SagB-type dehydrogenase family enzyme
MLKHLHDLDFLTSVGLLVSGFAAAVTGIVADLWDLNDFWYHTLAGYLAAGFAIAHVTLNWRRLTGYARFRLRSIVGASPPREPTPRPRPDAEPAEPAMRLHRLLLTRRGLFGLGFGAVVGLVLGRGLRPPPQIEAGSDVGVVYHQWSKPGLLDAFGTVANWGQPVELYKTYPAVPKVVLPRFEAASAFDGGLSAGRTIATRRSTRAFATGSPIAIDELSRLLFLAGGTTADLQGNARRAAPSSGALYPIEIYPVVHRVEGIEPGVYHYAVRDHALELVRRGDFRTAVVEQSIAQEFLGECGVVLFLTMIMQRMRPRYQDRSYRYGLLEAGHVGENAYLAATSMGLGACGVGAFMDDAINDMLGVDGVEEAVVYMVAAGRPRTVAAA